MSERFTIAEASVLLGISQRAVKHYRAIYTSDVIKDTNGRVYLTQRFLDKVKNTRSLDNTTITDSRTKSELLAEIDQLKEQLKEYDAEGQKIEVFTFEEYAIFEKRLIEWRIQRKEIELRIEQNAELKEDKTYLKARNEYLELSNNKILEQHEKLIEAIGQRARIEAVEKRVIPREPKEI